MERPRITLTKEELDRAEIPLNHVLIEMLHTSEGIKSKGGVIMGFNTDVTYAEGDDNSWVADLAECYGRVHKVPGALFFDPDDPQTMDWETEMDLIEDDVVWFSVLESKNSPEILCEKTLYKSIPYADCFCYKRTTWVNKWEGRKKTVVGMLNGYILCQQVYEKKLSDLDALSEDKVDKTKGIIEFIGEAPTRYIREEYSHIEDLRVGDEVAFDKKAPIFLLERTKALATFDGDRLFWVIQRRRISLILNR